MHEPPTILTELRENDNRTVEASIRVTFYAGSGLIAREIEQQIIRLIGTANILPSVKSDGMMQRHVAQRDDLDLLDLDDEPVQVMVTCSAKAHPREPHVINGFSDCIRPRTVGEGLPLNAAGRITCCQPAQDSNGATHLSTCRYV